MDLTALKMEGFFSDNEMSPDLMAYARDYLRAYTGDYQVVLGIRAECQQSGKLTRGQACRIANLLLGEQRRGVILHAVQTLAGVCDGARALDGQGFNGADAGIGHSFAARSYLTEKQARAAVKMLRKYRGQLSGLGIDYDTLPYVSTAPENRASATHGATDVAPGKTAENAVPHDWHSTLLASDAQLATDDIKIPVYDAFSPQAWAALGAKAPRGKRAKQLQETGVLRMWRQATGQ